MGPSDEHNATGAGQRADERRRASRISTVRPVCFCAEHPGGILQRGTAVDISHSGMQIRTRRPEPVGTPLQLEVHPEKGSSEKVVFVRGRVARVNRMDGGEFAMGVRIFWTPGREPAALGEAKGTAQTASAQEATPGRQRMGPSYAAVGFESADMGCDSARERSAIRNKGKRSRRWALILLALLPVLLLFLTVRRTSLVNGGRGGLALLAAEAASAEDATNREFFVLSRNVLAKSERDSPTSKGAGSAEGNAVNDRRQVEAFGQIRPEEAPAVAMAVDTREARPVAIAGYQAPLPEGRVVLASFVELLPGWTASARHGERIGNDSGPYPNARLALRRIVLERAAAQGDKEPGLWILVEKEHYSLSVFRGDAPLCRFPVGLGRNDSTPTGDYRIANKITNPDWFNRGERVPSDDPRNPLGNRWLGLGDEGGATSYGLHATEEGDSIGQPCSRGCIRMRPKDADTVFRLCPIGTPVRICAPTT